MVIWPHRARREPKRESGGRHPFKETHWFHGLGLTPFANLVKDGTNKNIQGFLIRKLESFLDPAIQYNMAQDVHLSQRKKSPASRTVAKHAHGSLAPKPVKKTETADPARTLQLVEAAEDVFLDKGYHSATMSDVAKAAGISKKTIYQIVESKAELFGMLLAHQQALLNFPKPQPGAAIRDILVQNLLYLAQVILSPKQIAMIRLIMTEYTHSPDLARIFHQKRITKAKSRLETCMMDIASCKRMTTAEIREMAAMLVGMALGEFHLGVLVGFRPMPTKAMLERRIGLAVDLFLSRSEIFSHP